MSMWSGLQNNKRNSDSNKCPSAIMTTEGKGKAKAWTIFILKIDLVSVYKD